MPLPDITNCPYCAETRRLDSRLRGCMGHFPINNILPELRYGYAVMYIGRHVYRVMYIDGEDMGEYLGYFQDSLESARSVADEILSHDDGGTSIGIYTLTLLELVDPPKDEEPNGD